MNLRIKVSNYSGVNNMKNIKKDINFAENVLGFAEDPTFDSVPVRTIISGIIKLGWKSCASPYELKSFGYNNAYVAPERLDNGTYRVILCNDSNDTIAKARTLDAPGYQIDKSSIRKSDKRTSSPGVRISFTKSDFTVR